MDEDKVRSWDWRSGKGEGEEWGDVIVWEMYDSLDSS